MILESGNEEMQYNKSMNKDEIKKEIEKVQKQLQELQEKLNKKSFSDPDAQNKIYAVAAIYRAALAAAGLNDISEAFGEVAVIGKYKDRGIFLTNDFKDRDWVWCVVSDDDTNSEVLVRIDKANGKIID
jgi:hypothetical protein